MKTLREKAEYLFESGISKHYFRLLLMQKKITANDKRIIEKLYKIVKGDDDDNN